MEISNEDYLTDIPGVDDLKEKLLPYRKQCEISDRWLKTRLDTVLPMVMKREGIDTWIVCNREHNEDPVFKTLTPALMITARRLTILVMHLNENGTVSRYSLTHPVPDIAHLYTPCWLNPKGAIWGKYFQKNAEEKDATYRLDEFAQSAAGVSVSPVPETQIECLARVVKELKPKKIGLDYDPVDAYADGLSHALYVQIMDAFDEEERSKVVSAAPLCIGWLETRIEPEMDAYHGIVQLAHAIIKEAYSSRVIHPGVTTNDDVRFWMMEKAKELGLEPWFDFETSIFRNSDENMEGEHVILPGDMLHCDIGISYLGLHTDTQEDAYILKLGEHDAPDELKHAMAITNRLQEITVGEFKTGRTGNEILKAAREKAIAEGIDPCIYSHPIGFNGHAAGPYIGLWDMQGGVPVEGDYIMHDNTAYSLELNAKVDYFGKKQGFGLETDVLLRGGKVYYLGGRQTKFHLVK